MKRSLALGALMAFVITGSAWAETITQDYIDRNDNNKGGAISLGQNVTVTIQDSKFYNNKPTGTGSVGEGGAIFVRGPGSVTLKNNEFKNNSSSYWGGAIALQRYGVDVTLKGNNIFDGNVSDGGGAISVYSATVNFGEQAETGSKDHTVFVNNVAKDVMNYRLGGGAIYMYNKNENSVKPKLNFYSNVDFVDNFAKQYGGAIYNDNTLGEINFIKGTATFTGNKVGVTFNIDGTVTGGDKNDIYNKGIINIYEDATVTLDGGIDGTGTVNIAGMLNGIVTGGKQKVALGNGTWNLAGGYSNVSTLGGTGKLKVDLTNDKEYVQVQSTQRAVSNIEIDHGGIIGVDIKQGVENYSKKIVDASENSLVDVTKIGDVFLQANVKVEETDGVRNVTTTIKPGDDFVIESNVTTTGDVKAGNVSLKETAEALNSKAAKTDVENALAEKADKTTLEAEATTREKADIGLQEQINNLSTGSNEAIEGINQRLGKMNGKINKVGAGAAALAALHPLDYDPDDKLTFSAGVGNYAGENAAALGAFYRPDEKLMFSLGGTMGNGENMVNLGVSIGLDGANGTPKLSRKELVQKVSAMEAENQSMKAEIAELKALVAELVNKK